MLLLLSQALACGGLFCNSAQPVDQVGERILFALIPGDVEGEGEVEVHVQLSYQGPAEEFSWIVPTPTLPELRTSVDDVFVRLGMSTAPLFQPTIVDLGDCNSGVSTLQGGGGPMADMAPTASGEEPFSPPQPAVTVVREEQVGPYDAQILTANDAGVLVQWLADNGYDLPPGGAEKIAPYVASGSYYIGLKLQKDKDAGDLTPIAFRYPGTEPTIPLQLTAVAAADDMPLQPFVLAPHRAVPDNYLHVVVNELAVDWLTAGANYPDVIRRAANEAGGQAFATDAAVPTDDLTLQMWAPDQYPLDAIAQMTDVAELSDMLISLGYISPNFLDWQTQRGIPVSNGTVPILSRFIDPGPNEPYNFFGCLRCYVQPGERAFDGALLAEALDVGWVQPMRHAQELLDGADWLTRLTSSISADEMTVDPRFVLNADLPAVPAARSATLEFDCRTVHNRSKAPRALVLADGRRLELPSLDQASTIGFVWDEWIAGLSALTADRVEQTGRQGAPLWLTDNRLAIDDELSRLNAAMGCGCATTTPGGWAWLGALALWARRRR